VPAVAALLAAADLSCGDMLAIMLPNWVARFKVPREVYIEVVLPKNAIGKLAKPVLRDRLRA